MARVNAHPHRVQWAAAQLGEFVVGVAVAYAAVGVAWSLTHAVWALVVAALVVVAAAIAIELRFGSRATGLVAGMLPTSMLVAGLFIALSAVAFRLS